MTSRLLAACTILFTFSSCQKCAECTRGPLCITHTVHEVETSGTSIKTNCFNDEQSRLAFKDSIRDAFSNSPDSVSFEDFESLDVIIDRCDFPKNESDLDDWIMFFEDRDYRCSKK